MAIYSFTGSGNELERWLRAAWAKTGKKLDMGKACVRFKKADDLALGAVGELFAKVSVDDYLAIIEKSRTERR
jgi:hypothetical protein